MTAAYLQVADDIRQRITSGQYPDGHRLPSIDAMAQAYDVRKGVVERAINKLRGEGLLVTRQGSGISVQRYARIVRPMPGRLARSWWGGGHAIQDKDTAGRDRDVHTDVGETQAPTWAAEALGIEPGSSVAFRSRRFVVDGRAVQLSTSYLPVDLARGTPIMYTDTGPGGVYARLEELGHGPTEAEESIVVRAPSPDEASRLDLLRRESLVYEITRLAFAEGRCVEANRMVLDVDVYRLVYRLPL